MRKEMLFKYLLVGIFIYLINLFYLMPHRLPRFLSIIIFVILLGTVIERLYYYMLTRKKIRLFGRLLITIPVSVLFMLLLRYITGQFNGYHLYVVALTIISGIILDQVNYQVYKHNHDQVNKQLDIIKMNTTHLE
ncbi:hypothetical protein [Vallitalea okinawensis]|uniref:hypothetical protein n=1 Tax=Vallitalea okinawensis TaxID=2078660 RepID=UPI000CFC38EE|nr:hypothetical protein [Vallitalea okinawensis]